MYDINGSHEVKNFVRRNLWKGREKPFRHILTLTSPTCGDIIDGLNRGLITRETRLTIFENNSNFVNPIREKLNSLGLTNFTIINNAIESNPWLVYEAQTDLAYDLIFLDFCGSFTEAIWNFLSDPVFHKAFHAVTTGITFSLNPRNNKFFGSYFPTKNTRLNNLLESAGDIKINKLENDSTLENVFKTVYFTGFAITGNNNNNIGIDSLVLYREDNAKTNMLFMRLNGSLINYDKTKYIASHSNSGLLKLTIKGLRKEYEEETNPAKKAWITRKINDLKGIET